MISTLLFMHAIYHWPQESRVIYENESITRLFFRKDKEGIGCVIPGKAILLGESGKIETSIDLQKDQSALFYSEDKSLISTTRNIFETNESKVNPYSGNVPMLFSQRDRIFSHHGIITYLGDHDGISFDYAPSINSGVGVSASGSSIAFLGQPSDAAPLLRIWKYIDARWTLLPKLITPRIEDIGDFTIMPGRNDIVFLSEDVVAFVGGPCESISAEKYGKWSKQLVDLTNPKDSKVTAPGENYLILVRLSDGLTKAYCRFSYGQYGERRNFGTNSLVSSLDGKCFYILQYHKIFSFNCSKVLSAVNL